MIARVVPVTRIRRDTAFWSYTLPARSPVQAGALVVVPFAGRDVLGVVWETAADDDKASKPVTQVLTSYPVVRAPQRRFIEHLSHAGLCSLSTALYVWMPRALRSWPLRATAHGLVAAYRPPTGDLPPQRCILVPGHRPDQEERLEGKFGGDFSRLFGDVSESDELSEWFRILQGEARVGLGRERALFAPWANLRYLTVVEPEDVFYYHEQVPYLSLSEAAAELARLTGANQEWRSYLPTAAAEILWPGAQGTDTPPLSLGFPDLRREPIVNDALLAAMRQTLLLDQRVLLLYNAHDRLRVKRADGLDASVLVPGIESLSRQLATALGREKLEPDIVLGTRSVFDVPHGNVGLAVALSVDPLLDSETFADQLHGLADLGHLFSYGCPTLIQAYRQDHPLLEALRGGRLGDYAAGLAGQQRDLALPPFGQQIVLSFPDKAGSREMVDEAAARLTPLLGDPWQVSHPLLASWHKKKYWNLMIESADPGARLPAAARKLAVSLPAPWKAMRNPWHIV